MPIYWYSGSAITITTWFQITRFFWKVVSTKIPAKRDAVSGVNKRRIHLVKQLPTGSRHSTNNKVDWKRSVLRRGMITLCTLCCLLSHFVRLWEEDALKSGVSEWFKEIRTKSLMELRIPASNWSE